MYDLSLWLMPLEQEMVTPFILFFFVLIFFQIILDVSHQSESQLFYLLFFQP